MNKRFNIGKLSKWFSVFWQFKIQINKLLKPGGKLTNQSCFANLPRASQYQWLTIIFHSPFFKLFYDISSKHVTKLG